ncbi:MAG: hypothetical protein SGILL_002306 [Bacillariaceae sp.]
MSSNNKETPTRSPMTALCRKRFVQHAAIVLGVVGLLSLAWWDGQDENAASGNPTWMLTGGGIVDPTSTYNGFFSDGRSDEVPDLTLWVPISEGGEEDEASKDDGASQSAQKPHHDAPDRLLTTISWKWYLLNERTSDVAEGQLRVDAIPGCPHCGQVDDDDVYISGDEMDAKEPSRITWKAFSLQPVFTESGNHGLRRLRAGEHQRQDPRRCTQPYCDQHTMRWHLNHNQRDIETKLCEHFGALLNNNMHGLDKGSVDVTVDDPSAMHTAHGDKDRREEDAFFSSRERMRDAVYGPESYGPSKNDSNKNRSDYDKPMTMFGVKCKLQIESFKPQGGGKMNAVTNLKHGDE